MGICKFEVGKEYKTRDGRPVLIYNIYKNEIHGVIYPKSDLHNILFSWDRNGRSLSGCESIADIMPPEPEKRVVKGWFNMYINSRLLGGPYETKEKANRNAARSRVACIYREIEYYVGEGLDESST